MEVLQKIILLTSEKEGRKEGKEGRKDGGDYI
jgi:hypothetical protein